ncbi:OprD family porin [Pseudomonas sp. PS02288]|uniref:OprD family porin n=1 Tax=Pseudomonas sp. PS02288 TaxID=2991443 RepID=UPI00249B96C8|nr:OprD family porin [Pseudomonas sp. PS02288]
MSIKPLHLGLASVGLGIGFTLPSIASAEFLEDSKAELELRNFYFNGDYRQEDANQSKREEWAQGFLLRYQSGFTQGTVGFGVDALGLLGVKLDSGQDRQNSGLLPVGDDRAPDDYSRVGATAKARIANSTLRFGTLIPRLPTVQPNNSRLLPQTFQGTQLTSKDIDDLTLNLGRLTENNLRNSSGGDKLAASGSGLTGRQDTDTFDFFSASYKWSKALTTGYSYAHLDANYKQHIFNLSHDLPFGKKQALKSDIRYARSTDDGATNVDNNAFGAKFTYSFGFHALGAAYQKMSGGTGFPYLQGTDPFLVNYVMLSPDFANPDERSWQVRYDYDFAGLGIPGLSFMTRYLRGDNFELANGATREWERDTDIQYTFQSGALKNLAVRWRNGTYRSGGDQDIDQNRLIVSYTIPLL